MRIEDVNGNEITEYDLAVGKLEKSERDGETIMIYFPFTDEEQTAYDLQHANDENRDAAICELYEMILGGI